MEEKGKIREARTEQVILDRQLAAEMAKQTRLTLEVDARKKRKKNNEEKLRAFDCVRRWLARIKQRRDLEAEVTAFKEAIRQEEDAALNLHAVPELAELGRKLAEPRR